MRRYGLGKLSIQILLLLYLLIVAAQDVHAVEHPIHLDSSDCVVFQHGCQPFSTLTTPQIPANIHQPIEKLAFIAVYHIKVHTSLFNARAPPHYINAE